MINCDGASLKYAIDLSELKEYNKIPKKITKLKNKFKKTQEQKIKTVRVFKKKIEEVEEEANHLLKKEAKEKKNKFSFISGNQSIIKKCKEKVIEFTNKKKEGLEKEEEKIVILKEKISIIKT